MLDEHQPRMMVQNKRHTTSKYFPTFMPLINASAVGYYGAATNHVVDDASPPGDDFMAAVCNAWEAEALKIEEHGLRAVMIRTGIVLSRDGGAVAKLLLPFRMFAEYLFPMRSFLGHWARSCIAPLFFIYQSLFSV